MTHEPAPTAPATIVVLASGRGSNLRALLDAERAGRLSTRVVAVLSDKASAGALEIAREHGIATHAFAPRDYYDRLAFDLALFDAIAEIQPTLIVCAGYMRILSAEAVDRHVGRMINIHPSLLPAYQGLHTHARVLRAGDRVHGASVHFVTPELDGGPVIAQATLAVEPGDTAESLARRLLPIEHRLLVATVDALVRRPFTPTPFGVALDGRLLAEPLRLGDDDRLHGEDDHVA
jgi:phosphoribosylglycinamide formyltransferase 1